MERPHRRLPSTKQCWRLRAQSDRTDARQCWSTKRQIVPITAEIGRMAVEAFARFGRGNHPARLNLGDCFAYACARNLGVPLLFKGTDFSQTDIATV